MKMNTKKHMRLCGLEWTALLAFLHPVFVMSAPAEDTLQYGGAQSDIGLAEIVVTAQKREQSINNVPMSINALTGNQLARPRGFGLDSEPDGGGTGRQIRHLGADRGRKSR